MGAREAAAAAGQVDEEAERATLAGLRAVAEERVEQVREQLEAEPAPDPVPRGRPLVPWVHPDGASDADSVDRKFQSLRNLFATLVDGEANDGHDGLFSEWLERGFPLEVCRQAIREVVQEKRGERDRGAPLRPKEIRPGLLRSVVSRLRGSAGGGATQRSGPARPDATSGTVVPLEVSDERRKREDEYRAYYAKAGGVLGA